jgi:hypothetical protein
MNARSKVRLAWILGLLFLVGAVWIFCQAGSDESLTVDMRIPTDAAKLVVLQVAFRDVRPGSVCPDGAKVSLVWQDDRIVTEITGCPGVNEADSIDAAAEQFFEYLRSQTEEWVRQTICEEEVKP